VHRGWDEYLQTGDGTLASQLFFTVQTELWLRARDAVAAPEAIVPAFEHGAREHALS
jgi:hypothetical protein